MLPDISKIINVSEFLAFLSKDRGEFNFFTVDDFLIVPSRVVGNSVSVSAELM